MKNIRRTAVPALAILATLAGGQLLALAQAPDVKPLVVTATNRTAAAEAAGGSPRNHDRVDGGDVVQYLLTFTNVTDQPVRQVVVSNPVPQGFRMVAGSVKASRADARPEYSIDAGSSFSAQPMEEVLVDGRPVRRPAAPEKYTHVRWTVDGWVAPGATVVAEFDARLGAVVPAAGSMAVPATAQRGR
jgi:uncharacterized repeat protein (TIGR01451 family)